MKLIDCYYIVPETQGRFQLLKSICGGYAAVGCYFSPDLAARDVAEGMRRQGKSCCQRDIEDRIREILNGKDNVEYRER